MVHIIYNNFLTPDGTELSIGGIQTYINELKDVINGLGYDVIIHQRADKNFNIQRQGYRLIGYKLKENRWSRRKLLDRASCNINQETDIVIFGCETNAVKKLRCPTIGIQHGVFWDKPGKTYLSVLYNLKVFIKKSIKAYQTVRRIGNVDTLVCVDYNFVNWYRAVVNCPQVRLCVTTNFCKVPEHQFEKSEKTINIIFARRFFEYRGTRIFVTAVKRIVNEYQNVRVTIAGDGPDEFYLRENLKGKNYIFTSYSPHESLKIHEDKHIAVIPTLGSEGTSLSLLEAMAAGCVPICTNVGGMTNIVLDHFNGIMVSPTSDELYLALKELIENDNLRIKLAKEAYRTVISAFNYTKWKSKWEQILLTTINNK